MGRESHETLLAWLRTPRTTRDLLRYLNTFDALGKLESVPESDGVILSASGRNVDGLCCVWYWAQLARDSKRQLRRLNTFDVDIANARRVNSGA